MLRVVFAFSKQLQGTVVTLLGKLPSARICEHEILQALGLLEVLLVLQFVTLRDFSRPRWTLQKAPRGHSHNDHKLGKPFMHRFNHIPWQPRPQYLQTFSGTTKGLRYSRVSIWLALRLFVNFSAFPSIFKNAPMVTLVLSRLTSFRFR